MSGQSPAKPISTPSQDRYYSFLFCGIFAVGILLRVYDLARRSIWFDEGAILLIARKVSWPFGWCNTLYGSDPPLLPAIVHLLENVLYYIGVQPGSVAYDVALHGISCVFSIVAVFAFYRLAVFLFKSKGPALAATFFCAFSPFQVYYAQELKPYSLFFLYCVCSILCVVGALETNRWRYWIGLVLLFGTGMYGHLFFVWTIIPANLYFLLYWVMAQEKKRLFFRWTASQVVAAILTLPAVYFAYQWDIIFEQIKYPWNLRPDWKTGFLTFKSFFAGYGCTMWAYWGLFFFCGALFLYGLWLFRRQYRLLGLVLLFSVFSIGANVIIWQLRKFPFYEHRTFMASCVVIYLTAGFALWKVIQWRKTVGWVLVGVLCLFMGVGLQDYYAQRLHPMQMHRMGVRYKVANREAAAYIRAHLQSDDFVGHSAHFTLYPFRHYLRDIVRQRALRCTDGELEGFLGAYPAPEAFKMLEALPTMMDEAVGGARRVWLVEGWWEPFERPNTFPPIRMWLRERFQLKERVEFDGVTVTLYEKAV